MWSFPVTALRICNSLFAQQMSVDERKWEGAALACRPSWWTWFMSFCSVCVWLGTWRGRLGTMQVIPKPTSSRLVKMKALVALTIFWICLSGLRGWPGSLVKDKEGEWNRLKWLALDLFFSLRCASDSHLLTLLSFSSSQSLSLQSMT